MKKGQKVLVQDAFAGQQLKRVVAVEEKYVYICRDEEFSAASVEKREPICIGFRREYIIDTSNSINDPNDQNFCNQLH